MCALPVLFCVTLHVVCGQGEPAWKLDGVGGGSQRQGSPHHSSTVSDGEVVAQ